VPRGQPLLSADGGAILSVSMRIYEVSPGECEEILLRSDLGRLACAREDQPYIVPIHFSFDATRKCLYAFSTVGQKIHWMRQNPKVCVEVDDIADKNHRTTVLAFGRYEELDDSWPRRRRATPPRNCFRNVQSGGSPLPRRWGLASTMRW
jgi:nitroimidazol reductase NimA-like FMN-containing flavoprotein (pyridoxamine 5'-phosphate oxidase superfamily)